MNRGTSLTLFLLLIVILLSSTAQPAKVAISDHWPAEIESTSSPVPSPPSTLSPTLAALPTVPVAVISRPLRRTATLTPSATPTWTATATTTPSPSPTLTPPPTSPPTDTPTPPTWTPTVTPLPPTWTPTVTPLPPTWTPANSPVPPTPVLTETLLSASPTPSVTATTRPPPTPVPMTAVAGDIVHILLIGGDSNYTLDMNTDTLIVVVVNRRTRQVSLLSIPRDLWVYIPIYGWGRINIAHRIGARFKYSEGGGPGLLARTIEENLGVPVDHWVRVSYQGFARVVDELGGVDMTVACPVNLRYQPPTSEDEQELILQPGIHHLDGATALRYVRTRRGESDFARARRQQQFLRTVWDEFKSPDIIPRIPGLWSVLKGAFATDLNLGDILALAPVALDLQPQRVRSRYIGPGQLEGWTTPEGWRVQLPISEKVQQVVASLYWPPSAEGDGVVSEAARVQVRNGTDRPQLALIAAEQLRWEGLQAVDTGPAGRVDYRKTQIVVFNDKPAALALLTRLLGVKLENVIRRPDPGQQADIEVILGMDYDPCR